MKQPGYQPRTYRSICRRGTMVGFQVVVKESDLFIRAETDLTAEADKVLRELRGQIEAHNAAHRDFADSLAPVAVPDSAPEIVRDMAWAASQVGVGPMAAVAGAIAHRVAVHLGQFSKQVVVENGGDDFLIGPDPVVVAIYAGSSPLSMKLGIETVPGPEGLAVCTSSGTVGHSLSFGRADAVVAVSRSGSLADAAATALGNMVKRPADIELALDRARQQKGILGAVIIIGERIGFCGNAIKLVNID